MITTVTLWTLLVWADPRFATGALVTVQIPGFVSQDACMTAARVLRENNTQALTSSPARSIGEGEKGIDIKLMSCIPVETRQNPG